ncbi:hypothetical protein [Caulobacter sp. 17J80-11]|jgi:hypothetical protein|uniref:hypothetical protein n=1 Tax=Caulobacter sp. 17J80-11 TaxID=2763502 RepID=UPI0016538261|nr:hypothetical protein [Caulobacter sp. 17J80-11]MBC6983570.1 hypothetical protein [Caulobacter sp. 17J80-11]
MPVYLERPALRASPDEVEVLRATTAYGAVVYINSTPELLALFGRDRAGLFEAEDRGGAGWDVRYRVDVAANDNLG